MKCPHCGGNIPSGSTSCGTCGAKVIQGVYCPYCRNLIPQTAAICPKCGKQIKPTPTYIVPPKKQEKEKPSKLKSFIAVAALLFIFFSIVGSCMNSSKPNKKDNTPSTISSSLAKPTETPKASPTPIPEPAFTEAEIKDLALSVDSEIMDICGKAWDEYNTFVSLLSQEGVSELEIYRAAEAAKDSLEQLNLQINMVDISNLDIAQTYKDGAIVYVYTMLDVSKKTLKYLDDPVTSKLAKVQEATESVSNYVFVTATRRTQFLADAGFTTEEVNQIVDSSVK